MATALTLYGTTLGSTVIAGKGTELISTGASGAQGTTIATTVGASTGWFEIYTDTTNSTGTAGSQGSPTGHGQIFDATTLDGKSIIAGNWTPTQTFKTSTSGHTATCDLVYRIYKYNGGTYTLQGSFTHAAQTITNTSTQFTPSAASLNQMDFVSGDHVYLDIWINITATTCTSGDSIQWRPSSSTSSGWTGSQLVTPGFGTTAPAKNAETRFKLATQKLRDGVSRFVQHSGTIFKTGSSRFLLSGAKKKDGETRLKTNAVKNRDANTRFRQSINALYSFHIRFIQLSITTKSAITRFKQVSGTIFKDGGTRFPLRQVSAISLYMVNNTSAFLGSADQVVTSSSSTIINSPFTTTIGTTIGYGEIYAKGTTQLWQGATTSPIPSGNGFLYDSTAFELSAFLTGAWSARVNLNTTTGIIIADVHVRAWRYSTTLQTYTLVIDMVQSAVTIGTTIVSTNPTAFTTNTSGEFFVGDKLYFDIALNILSNTALIGTAAIVCTFASSTTAGNYQTRVDTTGHGLVVGVVIDAKNRFKQRANKSRDVIIRLRQSIPRLKDGSIRFLQRAQKYRDGLTLFRQYVPTIHNWSNRFKLSVSKKVDAVTRFIAHAMKQKDASSRLKLSGSVMKDGETRFLQRANKSRDANNRFLLQSVKQYHDGVAFFKIHFVQTQSAVTRFKQVSGTIRKDAVARFKQSGSILKNAISRFKLSANQSKNAETRFRQSVPVKKDASSRLKAMFLVLKDGSSRFRLNSPLRQRDFSTRLRQSIPVKLDMHSRLRISVSVLKNAQTRFLTVSGIAYRMGASRFKMFGPVKKNYASRFRQSIPVLANASSRFVVDALKLRNGSTRFLQRSATQYKAAISRFKQYVPKALDGSTRFIQRGIKKRDAEARFRQSIPIADDWNVRIKISHQIRLDQIARLRLSGLVLKNGVSRLKTRFSLAKDGLTLFRQSVPKKLDASARILMSIQRLDNFATRFKQRANSVRSSLSRFRLSVSLKKNGQCRLLTFALNPRDARCRFVLRPNSVGNTAAETEVVFPDGIFEAKFAG